MSLQGNSPFYPLVLMITEREREREERERERERERGLCVCVYVSVCDKQRLRHWELQTKNASGLSQLDGEDPTAHQDNRGPHLGDLSEKATARDLYDQTRSLHHAETERCRRGVFHWFFDWHSTAPAGPPALHGLPDVYAVPTVYDSTKPVSFVITVGHPSLGTAGIVRGAPDQHILRGVGTGDALHGGAHHHPAQFLGLSR